MSCLFGGTLLKHTSKSPQISTNKTLMCGFGPCGIELVSQKGNPVTNLNQQSAPNLNQQSPQSTVRLFVEN